MAVHLGGRGPGHMARVLLGSSAAPVTPTYAAESRPATIALSPNLLTAGDSTEVGVGTSISPTDYSWIGQLKTLLSSGTVTRKEVSGMAYAVPGGAANTSPIPTQVQNAGATPLAQNTLFTASALNDYNTGVNPEPGAQAWVAGVLTGLTSITGYLTGGADQWWTYLAGFAEDNFGPGMRYWSDWRYLLKQVQATYGAKGYDIRRKLQASVSLADPTDIDYINVFRYWGLPLQYRGSSSLGTGATALWTYSKRTVINTTSTATNTVAGIETAAPSAGFSEGDYIQNINAAAVLGTNIFRKQGSGWALMDNKHCSRFGYAVFANAAFDILAALQASGAPCACPAELFCAKDAAAGATLGTIYYVGAAPASMAIFDASGTYISTLTLTDNGVSHHGGTITVTRSGTGSLTEGEQLLQLQLTDAGGHVLHSPVDFRVGQPSTQTVPRLWTLPNAGLSTPDADFSMMGREVNGYSDGATFHVSGWVNPSDLSTQPYLVHHAVRTGTSSDFFLQITSTGALKLVAHNAAGTLILNNSTTNTPFAANTSTWFAVDIDVSTSPATITGYFNKNGAGDTAMTFGAAPSGGTTLAFTKMLPRFFAARDASLANWMFAATDASRNQFKGKFGNLITACGNIGVATAGNRRLIWNTDGTAAARAPMSTINGVTPIYDIQGGIGDFLNGGFNTATQPVYGTYRGIIGLT